MPVFIAGEIVTAAKLNAGTSRDWAAWTPTLTNLAVGTTGAVTARYVEVGKTCHFHFRAVLGGTGISVGAVTFTLPAAAASTYSVQTPFGSASYFDTSASSTAFGLVRAGTLTVASLVFLNASALQNSLSASTPFAWATGDVMTCTGTYEVA